MVVDGNVLPFQRFVNYNELAVFIPESRADEVRTILRDKAENLPDYREGMDENWEMFVYNTPPKKGDAFYHIAYELYYRSKSRGKVPDREKKQ